MRLELTPEVLTQKAREIIARLGYPERPADSAFGFDYDGDFQDYVEKNDKPRPNWDAVLAARPSMLQYWYRQSPDDMVASGFRDQSAESRNRHAQTILRPVLSGMINLELDPQGRLTYFQAIPPQKGELRATPCSGVRLECCSSPRPDSIQHSFRRRNPRGTPWLLPTRAWHGPEPGRERRGRCASKRLRGSGKPVFFSLIGDWTKPDRVKGPEKSRPERKCGRSSRLALCLVVAVWGALSGATQLPPGARRPGRSASAWPR